MKLPHIFGTRLPSSLVDWVEFTVNVASTGTYNVKVQFHRNKYRAISKLLIDGTQLGADYDAHIDPADVVEADFGDRSLTAGSHAFRFEVTGRNSASSATDYQVAVDYIKLTPSGGTPEIAFCSASSVNSGSSNASSLVVPKPAGVVSGDFMLLSLSVGQDTAAVTAPSGWTLVRQISDGFRMWVYRKTANASEPSSYTWSIDQTNMKMAAAIVAFTGVSSSAPIQVENGAAETGNSSVHSTPSINTTGSSTWLVSIFSDRNGTGSTWTSPTGATEWVDTHTTASNSNPSISIHTQGPVSAGSRSHTATASVNSGAAGMEIIALQP